MAKSWIVDTKSIFMLLLLAALSCIGMVQGLNCYQCGQYNDGVGSITPCINYTATQLKECPKTSEYCIKYVSEGSTVRDCVPTCVEKEAWSTRTYCCKEDGCNSAPTTSRLGLGASLLLTLVALPAASAAVARPLHG